MKIKEGFKNKIIIILTISLIVLSIFAYRKISIDRQTNLLSTTIEEQVNKLVELSTVKYNYTNIVEYDDSMEFKGIKLPFTNKRFIVKYSGYIKAGIDLDTVLIDLKDKETVVINMDEPKIIENVISEEDVYFYDERDSIFNKLSFSDLYTVLIEEKENMKEDVIEKGILKDAEKNGEEILKSLLEGMGFKNINIKFK